MRSGFLVKSAKYSMRDLIDIVSLLEMPVNVRLIGSEQEGSFRKDDIALATNPKAREKIARIWHTSTADVDVYLLNDADGIWDASRRGDQLNHALNHARIGTRKELRPFGIVPRPEAISVVLTQNEGDARVPLTGWMLAHRLYHALAEPGRKIRNPFDPQQRPTYPRLAKPFNIFDGFVQTVFHMAKDAFPHGGIDRTDLGAIGTTRACRQHNLSTWSEMIPESFAQYMLAGKVVLRPLATEYPAKFGVNMAELTKLNAYIVRFQAVMVREFQKMIDYAKGKAFML